MFISAERLWDMDRRAEITTAIRKGVKKSVKKGEKQGEIKTTKRMILRAFSSRFPECQDLLEIKRRLKSEKDLDVLNAKFDSLLALSPDAAVDEELRLL